MSTQLEAAQIEVVEGYDAAQTAFEPDCYVVGNAISRGNALLEEVLEQGLPYLSGPQWLAENVLQGRWVLAVAGTHGKTTTSAMLAWILEDAGLSPGFLVGGVPVNFGVSARLSGDSLDSPFFVIEADEYDTAFCDKRSKFVHYRPRTAILNNLEFDHADIFPDLAAIETQFHHLVRTLPRNALIVSNAAEANLERVLARGCWTPVERFNEPCGWRADGSDVEGSLHLLDDDQLIGTTHWGLSGAHNRSNAVAALLAARHAGVPLARGLAALSRFRNVKRRLEICGTAGGVTVYDDFAHHPTAIATTLGGLRCKVGRSAHPGCPRTALEHHEAGVMKALLPASLADADLVFCYAAISAGTSLRHLPPWARTVTIEEDLEPLGGANCRRRTPRRSGAGDEQRRLWRHPREAADSARRHHLSAGNGQPAGRRIAGSGR
jgi:UDP-N-acetylmuramate: L-alanyl-gamma-D-glutamyl-meso-diaminopimelate ligase